MDVVIFCGGKGTRLGEETVGIPKPLVEIGGTPILIHIMRHFAKYGHKRFILTLGYKGYKIKEYFYGLTKLANSVKFDLKSGIAHTLGEQPPLDWEVLCVDTGIDSEKGSRLKQIQPYVQSDKFFVTYGDGVADVDLDALLREASLPGAEGVVTGVNPPSRFGEMRVSPDGMVERFEEKAQMQSGVVNGGFFVFTRSIFDYVQSTPESDFEFGAIPKFSVDRGLRVYDHKGFWQCMDNVREKNYLDDLIKKGNAPWLMN